MILNEAQLNALDPKDRNAYMLLESLFAHGGWKYLKKLAESRREDSLKAAAYATSWEQNRACFGNAAAWDSLAKLEEETAAVYNGKLEEKARKEAEEADVLQLSEANTYE